MAQKRILLSGFCSQLPGKVPGTYSKEILLFIQTLLKVGRKEGGMETMRAQLVSCAFSCSAPQGCDVFSMSYVSCGEKEGQDSHLGKGWVPSASSSWAPHSTWSPLSPFKIMAKASADRVDKAVEGTASSVCFPTACPRAAGQNTKAEWCQTWGFLISTLRLFSLLTAMTPLSYTSQLKGGTPSPRVQCQQEILETSHHGSHHLNTSQMMYKWEQWFIFHFSWPTQKRLQASLLVKTTRYPIHRPGSVLSVYNEAEEL